MAVVLLTTNSKAHKSRPTQGTAVCRAEYLCIRWSRKSGKVPETKKGLRAIIWIAHEIAKILFKVDLVYRRIAGCQTRSRKATAHRADAPDLPVSEHLLNWAGPTGAPASSSSEGKLIESAVDPIDLGIECGWSVIESQIVDVGSCLAIAAISGRRACIQALGPGK